MAENKKTPELKEILWHPLVLVVLGAGVVWDAPGNIVVRSIFLVALWILVSLDIGWLLWRMRWRLHSWAIIVCAASQLSGMGTMEIMKWLLSEKLEEQQKDVAAKLDATMFFPASLNIFQSATNIKNRGNTAVGKHYLRCYIVSLVDGRRFWDDYLQPIEPVT